MMWQDKRVWVIAVVFAVCIIWLIPTMTGWDPPWWPAQKINLGLDLQGGMHVVLAVDVDRAIRDEMIHHVDTIKAVFKDRSLVYKDVHFDQARGALVIQFDDAASQAKVESYLKENWRDFDVKSSGLALSLTMNKAYVTSVRSNALRQAKETISNRVDKFNVREPEIYTQGADQIVVRLPGEVDPERAKKLIGQTAALEFKLVNGKATRAATKEQLLAPFGGQEPAGYKVYPERGKASTDIVSYFLLREVPELSGAYLTDARAGYDQYQQPAVDFTFNSEGAQKFSTITAANIGKQLAIVLDNVVYSAPTIQSRIGARGQITGSFTRDEALDLSIVLRAGALPVPIRIDEERTVGATLGEDSIRAGVLSFAVGGLAVVFFMGFYYRKAGLAADLAIIVNVAMILAGLAMFGATLTLPGIAGVVLTVGVAVDANVIIDERVREECRLGKTPTAAVRIGYDRAFWTIFDSHITALIASAVLYEFGTGAIKGFAVALGIGLIASLFTSIIVTRVIIEQMAVHATDHLSI
jgi:preprotein translocase subunit SecD